MKKLKINQNKVSGKYIHFGKLLINLGENPLGVLDDFYWEIKVFIQAILTDLSENPKQFKILKKYFVKELKTLVSNISKLTAEETQEAYSKMMEDKELLESIKLEFGVSNKRFDWDNGIKNFVDILQKKYHFDDNRIYKGI